MHPYLKLGLKTTALISALLLVVLAVLWLSISTSVTVVKYFIGQRIMSGIGLSILALVEYTVTVALVIAAIEILLELFPDWIYVAKVDTLSLRRARLLGRIRSMKAVYRKYPIYPKLKIFRDYDGY